MLLRDGPGTSSAVARWLPVAGQTTISLKARLARLIHPVERWVDRLKQGAPKDPVIDAYLGYASPEGLVLRGRVLSRSLRKPAQRTDSRWANFVAMLWLFATDEIAGIRVSVNDTVATTDEEGYFKAILASVPAPGWHSVSAHLVDFPEVRTKLEALVPHPEATYGVISDIDDTVMETGAYQLLRNLWTSLTGNTLTRRVYPDAKELIDRLHDGRNPVFYVSSSPWNIFGFLREIFDNNDVLRGPKFLRDLGISESQFITGTHGGHKGSAIDTILAANPGLPFVLIGDTGQEDAHVYLDAFHRHPGRIFQVVLREPGPGPDDDSRAAIATMDKAGLNVQTGQNFNAITVTDPARV